MTHFGRPLAILAATAGIAFATPASAQMARYCDGNLVANSFYTNVLGSPGGADVEYHGLFQNQNAQGRVMTATMLAIQRIGNFTVLRPIARLTLQPFEQKDFKLLAVHTANQGGTGAPSPVTVGQSIRFSCSFLGG